MCGASARIYRASSRPPQFAFLPADMVKQILNSGFRDAIDIQIDGADIERKPRDRNQILGEIAKSPAIVDASIERRSIIPLQDHR